MLERTTSAAIESHYDVQPVIDVYAGPDQRDLGGFAADVSRIVDSVRPKLPRGTTIDVRGQVETMRTSFTRLGLGMIFAVVLVYLVMAVNFQSWADPFIILMALPGAMAGMLWMLYLTGTTLNVPSLMGAIMCIGVATANSILLVTFANDEREMGNDAPAGRPIRGFHAHPAGDHDGAGNDHRHGSNGPGAGRGRRAECAVGARRNRRTFAGHAYDAALRADHIQPGAQEASRESGSSDQ